ncbi:MAG: DUF883 C-terminal domain-containing protein [Candidatus Pacearchaeota archaeon]|jgi:ElaB/YqjD/DUF883 family membrane-anchored ribosome-binding protein
MKKNNLIDEYDIRQRTHEGVDRIIDKAESLRDSSKERFVNFKENAIIKNKNFDDYIKENPKKAILIAAGAGLVLGAIIVSSKMRRN